MKKGDRLALYNHQGFIEFGEVAEVGLPNEFNSLSCFKDTKGQLFYMKPELYTGRHYNVGNKALWVIGTHAERFLMELI